MPKKLQWSGDIHWGQSDSRNYFEISSTYWGIDVFLTSMNLLVYKWYLDTIYSEIDKEKFPLRKILQYLSSLADKS